MTSNCDVTNSAHQMQMTTIFRRMKPPPFENILRTPVSLNGSLFAGMTLTLHKSEVHCFGVMQ